MLGIFSVALLWLHLLMEVPNFNVVQFISFFSFIGGTFSILFKISLLSQDHKYMLLWYLLEILLFYYLYLDFFSPANTFLCVVWSKGQIPLRYLLFFPSKTLNRNRHKSVDFRVGVCIEAEVWGVLSVQMVLKPVRLGTIAK